MKGLSVRNEKDVTLVGADAFGILTIVRRVRGSFLEDDEEDDDNEEDEGSFCVLGGGR